MHRYLNIGLTLLLLLNLLLIGCNSKLTSQSHTTTSNLSPTTATSVTTLPTTYQTSPVEFIFPDNGSIKLDGFGYFNFQRVFTDIQEPTIYKGVIFSPHITEQGITISGPVQYWFDLKFSDGAIEQLQLVSLGSENNIDINLSKHDQPKAGVMIVWHDVKGGLQQILYLLVNQE